MIQFNFSHKFDGVIWNTVAYPEQHAILLEVRDTQQKQVTFTALDYQTNAFRWKDKLLEEPWWINLSSVVNDVVLFTVYLDTNNPDKKGVMAFDLQSLELKWWNNDFSISHIEGNCIFGFSSRLGLKPLRLDVSSGKECLHEAHASTNELKKGLQKPMQYAEGMEYFETVRTFLVDRFNFSAVSSLEYLETESNIIVSFYVNEDGLANYLLVLSREGAVELNEKLDDNLKGIGFDTFFILEQQLFFVRNKAELVSYNLI